FIKKLFRGDSNERVLDQMQPLVDKINEFGDELATLDADQLRERTEAFRARSAAGESLDELLPEAFAVAREGIARETGERAFDVQLLGAIVLHRGTIAEM